MATQSPMDVDVQGGRVVRLREFSAFKAQIGELVVSFSLAAASLSVSGAATIGGGLVVTGATSTTTTSSAAMFLAGNGSAAAPSYTFTTQTSTGLYFPASAQLGVSLGGVLNCTFKNTGPEFLKYAADGGFYMGRANGTAASPSQVLSGERITYLLGAAYHSGGAFANVVGISFYAAENQTNTARGTFMVFETTQIGATSRTERVRIDPSGNVGIGAIPPSGHDYGAPMLYFNASGMIGHPGTLTSITNAYIGSGVWKAIAAGRTSALNVGGGVITGYGSTSAAGAGSNVTFAQHFTINTAGDMVVGSFGAPTTNPARLTVDGPLKVTGGGGDTYGGEIRWGGDGTGYNLTFQSQKTTATGTLNGVMLWLNDAGYVGVGASPTARNNCSLQVANSVGFPSSQVASSDVNALDDYEEGTFTPTITAASGTFTTVSASGEYTKIGNRVLWFVKVTITTNGTAATYVIASGFPFTFGQAHIGNGREIAALGWQLQTAGNASGSAINILKWDNTYPTDGSNGRELQVNGHHRV